MSYENIDISDHINNLAKSLKDTTLKIVSLENDLRSTLDENNSLKNACDKQKLRITEIEHKL